jgi:predicted nuclease of restriction endonuclease-like (RecB) superfamily
MRALAEAHPDHAFVQQVVARLPWGRVIRLLENVKDVMRREWYARQAIEHGWSRNVLVHQIESNLYERQGKALTNFSRTLPAVQVLTLGPDLLERDIERGLLEQNHAIENHAIERLLLPWHAANAHKGP